MDNQNMYGQAPPPGYGMPPNHNRGGGAKTGCMIVLGCLLIMSVFGNLSLIMALGVSKAPKPNQAKKFREVTLSGKGKNKIAVLRLHGAIMDAGRSSGIVGAASFIKKLEQARKDRNVKGIFIDANSPGGGVTASDKIYKALLKVQADKKPIVMLMGSTCASGCVYASAGVNKIIAHPTTVTGSIGVIISTLNFSKFMENHGIKGVAITSKENKALLSPFQPVKEEHKKILKDIVDEMYQRFVGIMAKGRNLPKAKVLEIADGRVFTAVQAKKYKLIDQVGYKADAYQAMLKLTKLNSARWVRYQRELSFFDIFQGYATLPVEIKESKRGFLKDVVGMQSPRFYYMWRPGFRP